MYSLGPKISSRQIEVLTTKKGVTFCEGSKENLSPSIITITVPSQKTYHPVQRHSRYQSTRPTSFSSVPQG